MSLEAKVWKLDGERPHALESSHLNLEERLEAWLCDDISLLNRELVVVGRQVPLKSGKVLDVLAVDSDANLVIVELKRDKTPRDVVAQVLDYASCVQDFGLKELDVCTQELFGRDFESKFREGFGVEVPETVNARHRMYIVGSSLDDTTQRIVEYLSKTHGVDINAATFTYFDTADGEFVARAMLVDEDEVDRRVEAKDSKRQRKATEEELRHVAAENGVSELWDIAVQGFGQIAKQDRSLSTMSFNTALVEGNRAVLSIFPDASDNETGLAVTVVFDHLSRGFDIEESQIRAVCGNPTGEKFGGSWSTPENCYYLKEERLKALLALVNESTKNKGN